MTTTTILSDNGVSSGTAGIKTTGGNDGVLALQTTTSGGTATTAVTIDNSQNMGLGVTPSAWDTFKAFDVNTFGSLFASTGSVQLSGNLYYASSAYKYKTTAAASIYVQTAGQHQWYNAPSGTAGTSATVTQAMTLDASGNLLVGDTSNTGGVPRGYFLATGSSDGIWAVNALAAAASCVLWNKDTANNNIFATFSTESAKTVRGSISYNRGGGLTAYNVTSDYRAKTVNGPVANALEKVSALKPSTGRMNDAEYDIDFFIAHELQEVVPSAVIGEKDAVKEDGTPEYQMVDKSALIPLLTAAIQEQQAIIQTLTERVAALENK